MIQEIYPYIDDSGNARPELIQHVSDQGKMLRNTKTGEEYSAPVDPYPCTRVYEETETDIPKEYGPEDYKPSEVL